ncbi:double-stranded RNA-specific editase B2-like isoform X2 [Phyllopteryx taeniolatus]|uniref:double-stranded RNA-specific editase B2-like isoform X2 n=1 Tax=Phyllopteryx taeniolatus TaxID=161469 RepID=UPI002AD21AE9|nr:double-stranded RNA-specific editase B2-like isoform X2 [Phyllopteryx taeniolatus]
MDVCEVTDVRKKRKRKRRSRVTGSRSMGVKKLEDQVHHLAVRKPSSRGTSPFPKRQGLRVSERKCPQMGRLTWKRAPCLLTRKKNSVVRLNELQPGLRYDTVSQTGPPHAPVFAVAVDVNDLRFEGSGPTKKQAKMRAAELALKSFVQFPEPGLEGIRSTETDFTNDRLDQSEMFCAEGTVSENWTCVLEKEVLSCSRRPSNTGGAVGTWLLRRLGPVGLLGELRPGLRYFCLTERLHGRPDRSFIAAVRVEGRMFEGCGRSKRDAKARAAAAALCSLYDIGVGPERNVMGLQGDKQQLPQFFAESIFQLVRQKYEQLMDQRLATHNMAAFIMTTGFEANSAEVVSMATGTKCLDWDASCHDDRVLRDCHAEVVCRRALLRFLYAQLEMLLICPPDETDAGPVSIFEPATGRRGVFRLRDHVGFHMFVTSSPCGDARLNCPYENYASPSMTMSALRCGLRTKVGGGQGTLPVTARPANQKTAGVSPGKPRVSMSCTDKIAKWCAVGLQGALLSHLVEPVYLHSLTVGTLSHTGHLQRVLTRRLAPNKRCAAPYRRKPPLLACLNMGQRHACGTSSRVSINWSSGDGDTEELSTSSGLCNLCGTPSRLSGRRFFTHWQRLRRRLNNWTPEDMLRTHIAWKRAAGPYQKAVQQFGDAVRDAGLGVWSRKLTQSA